MATPELRPTHREETPIRTCVECGAYLRSYHNSEKCDPCDKGKATAQAEHDVWGAAADGGYTVRRALFAGLEDLMEAA